ncbi:MAG TPA: hypothetical protein PLH94_08320 [Fimbriimonadaceae bacterium]|nr:hypothetical protein [Fimbriimonadaceae bacterium]
MAVANIECRLAQAQMNLFLSGDPLGEDVLGELEDHIAECADCRRMLATKRLELLAQQAPAPAAKPSKAPSKWNPLREKPTETQPESAVVEARPRTPMGKPLVYSIGLAAVLVAMSFFSDPTRLFGDRLATAKTPTRAASPAPETTPVSTSTAPAPTPAKNEPDVVASELALEAASNEGAYPLDTIDQPPATPDEERAAAAFVIEAMNAGAEEAAPAVETPPPAKPVQAPPVPEVKAKPTDRRPIRRVRSQAPRRSTLRRATVKKPAAKGGGIRVYDSQGNPIRP